MEHLERDTMDKELYTEKDLIKDLARLHQITEDEATDIYRTITNLIEYNVQQKKLIRFRRLFSFKANFHKGRTVRDYLNNNPDKIIKIKSKYGLVISPSQVLRNAFSKAWNENKDSEK